MTESGAVDFMVGWGIAGVIFVGLATLGVSMDRLILARYKPPIYDAMITWWIILRDTSIAEFPKITARWTLKLADTVLGGRGRRWLILGLASFTATAIAIVLGS